MNPRTKLRRYLILEELEDRCMLDAKKGAFNWIWRDFQAGWRVPGGPQTGEPSGAVTGLDNDFQEFVSKSTGKTLRMEVLPLGEIAHPNAAEWALLRTKYSGDSLKMFYTSPLGNLTTKSLTVRGYSILQNVPQAEMGVEYTVKSGDPLQPMLFPDVPLLGDADIKWIQFFYISGDEVDKGKQIPFGVDNGKKGKWAAGDLPFYQDSKGKLLGDYHGMADFPAPPVEYIYNDKVEYHTFLVQDFPKIPGHQVVIWSGFKWGYVSKEVKAKAGGKGKTQVNTPLTIDPLAGNSNSDITLVDAGNGSYGTTQINDARQIVYTPDAGFVGQDQFPYTVNEGGTETTFLETVDVQPVPTNAAIIINSLSPSSGSGAGGTSVTITGSGFTNVTGVLFGGVPSPTYNVNPAGTQITASTPPHAAGSVAVQVMNASGISAPVAADQFTFTAPPVPVTSGLDITSGPSTGGTAVQITGTGFTGASEVDFGTVAVTATPTQFIVNSDTRITVHSPAQAPGTVHVIVKTPGGESATSTADQFTYASPYVPTVNTVTPSTGSTAGGNGVTIWGTNFSGLSAVFFGGVPSPDFWVYSGTTTALYAVAPSQAPGVVDITVVTPNGTSSVLSADQYTYATPPPPAVTGITPASGPPDGDIAVTITGTNFGGLNGVFFGNVPAVSYRLVSRNAVVAMAPAGVPGTVDVTVSTPGGTSSTSASDHFTYNSPAAPAISGLSVTSGSSSGNTMVTITGSGFTSLTSVSFGSVPAASVTVYSNSRIVAMSPAEPPGTVDITAQSQYGTSALVSADRFAFVAASLPSISSVGPSSGWTSGGAFVKIAGNNLLGVRSVAFGTVPATSFWLDTPGWIWAVTPPHAAGTVDVTVTTYAGTSPIVTADHFTFNGSSAPTVATVNPATGPTSGGTVVTLFGSGFTGASHVYFGNNEAFGFTVYSDGALVATAPPGAAGMVDITVITPNGTSSTSSADHFTYSAGSVASVASVTPNWDYTLGGKSIVIVGSNFGAATQVYFGSVPGTIVGIYSDTMMVVIDPPHPVGTVDVTVVNDAGTSSISSADHFTYVDLTAPAPAVTWISQGTGTSAGGTTVTILGSNFGGTSGVSFGGTPASSFTVNNSGQITATAPPHSAGVGHITVTTNNGTSSTSGADQFTWMSPPVPAVTGISPSTGTSAGGASVTITGTNFTGATVVSFGWFQSSSFTVNSDTQITATAPPQGAGVMDITVTTPSGTSAAVSADQFTVTAAAGPAITSLSPATGTTAGGATVTITGSGFTGANGVLFGDIPAASFTVNSNTQITATAPPGSAGSFPVTVTTYSGTSALVSGDVFTVTLASTPTVTSLSGSGGTTAGGASITITGSAFTGASSVMFGTMPASFTVVSDTQITAVSPPDAVGTISVTVTTGSGTSASGSANQFTYTAGAAPSVTSLDSSSGSTGGGLLVTITGSGFTGTTGVSFGTVPATLFAALSDTQIIATAPPQLAGTVHVTVTTYGGTSTTSSSDQFTYSSAGAPAITSINGSGTIAGGDNIAILGSGFTGASEVLFGKVPAAYFTVFSDNAIIATTPALMAGTWHITVTTLTGTSATSSADQFTPSTPAVPTVSSLSATSGSTAGGSVITIAGTGLATATAVWFGSVRADTFTVNSDTLITAVVPAQIAGPAYVAVVTAGGTSAPASGARFTYSAAGAPTVTSLDTTSGSSAGGTVLTITGTNFSGVTSVLFGTTMAASYTVYSSTQIVAVAPSLAAGAVSIVVTTATGNSATSTSSQFTFTAASTPAITGIGISTGTSAGGAIVGITGSGFTGATAVKFGTTVATSFTVDSDTQITATAPPLTAGTIHITVTTTAGTSSTSSADQFTVTAAPAPAVSALTPTTGSAAGGSVVTILGSNFTGATGVSFGTVAASWFIVNSDGSITAAAPASTAGSPHVTVTTRSGTSSTSAADQFTYSSVSLPTVTALSTTSGTTAGGVVVLITGTGFTSASQVKFGSVVSPQFVVNTDTLITAVLPPEAAATVHTTVTNYAGTSATGSADQFTITNASVPTVTAISATSGPNVGGTIVTITGTNFTGANGVSFGSTPATWFSVYSPTVIVAKSPASGGMVDITVSTFSGTSATSGADQFTYWIPTVTGLSPNSGYDTGGDVVTITGTSFLGTTVVMFGGVAASFTVTSSTTISVTTPASSWDGTVYVTVTNAYGTSTASGGSGFTYFPPPSPPPPPPPPPCCDPIGGWDERIFVQPSQPVTNVPELAVSELATVIPEAISAWQQAGANAEQVQALEDTRFKIADLPATYLGLAVTPTTGTYAHAGLVLIDGTAQGFGWFIDSGSTGNSAFSVVDASGELHAGTDSPAYGHVDLLTVVTHEFGHILGLLDVSNDLYPGNIMDVAIDPGVRRIPGDLASLFASNPSSTTSTQSFSIDEADVLLQVAIAMNQQGRFGGLFADPNQGGLAGAIAAGVVPGDASTVLNWANSLGDWLFVVADWRPTTVDWADDLLLAINGS